jgi:hypothetical protein
MSDKVDITIRIPSDAQSRAHTPYMMHDKFVDYCKANHVDINASALEAYEKNGLLSPCIRVLYPRELLRRSFRANHLNREYEYKIRDEWKPLTELDNSVASSSHWINDGAILNIEKGHPLERALSEQNPYVIDPSKDKFRAWKRFKILEGLLDGHEFYKSRADNYYAPWKIFQIDDLNVLNTDMHNRATGRGWGFLNKRLRSSSLTEFHAYFRMIVSFAYRRYLISVRSFYPEQITINHGDVVKRYKAAAKDAFKIFSYEQWIRFLRKLIELYETSKEREKYLLSEEARTFAAYAVQFIISASHYDFRRICADVSGNYNKYLGKGMEDGVLVYAGSLEEMFPDEKWDLEQNIGEYFPDGLKEFNRTLIDGERIPEMLAEQLFDELVRESGKMALAAIRKMDIALNSTGLFIDEEMWSGVRDFATSIEVHGKEWLGGNNLEDVLGKLCSRFSEHYGNLKTRANIPNATNATDAADFIDKLTRIWSSPNIPVDRRCGRHLFIAQLVRNYTGHQKGLTGEVLRENLGNIYRALINTLFVLYAAYKKQ